MKKKPPRAKRLLASCLLTVRFKSQSERPLSDNGKPVVRPGRKATGQRKLIAGLPKRGAKRSRRRGQGNRSKAMTKTLEAGSKRSCNSRLRIRGASSGLLTLLIVCLCAFSPALAKPSKVPTGTSTTTSSTLTGYTFCATENQYCSFTGQKTVAYGASGQFAYLTLTGGTACTNAVFGDPLVGSGKACYTQNVGSSGFDFSLANQGDLVVNAGSAITTTITAALASGSSQTVGFSLTGLPTGGTASFSRVACNPSCSTVLTVQTTANSTGGKFPLTISATGGGVTKTTTFVLTLLSVTTLTNSSGSSTQPWT